MRRRASLVLLTLAALALLVGCGGDDGADAKTTTTVVLPPEWAGADFLPEDANLPAPPAVAAPEDVDFCDAYGEAQAAYDALSDDLEELSDGSLEELKAGVATFLEKVDAVVATAPEEAREQLDGIADAIDEVAASVSGAETLAEAQEATEAIATNQDFASVGQHLSMLAATRCPGT